MSYDSTITVFVRHRFPGFHGWPEAPDERAYLRDLHRHLFHVEVEIEVDHEGREIEFHDLLDDVAMWCGNLGDHYEGGEGRDLGAMSCESIAAELSERLLSQYPRRSLAVCVSEDGEAGSTYRLLADGR